MINSKVSDTTSMLIKELEQDDYDYLIILNPLLNMTVQTINSSITKKIAYSYNNPIDIGRLKTDLDTLTSNGKRVKLIYFKRPRRGSKDLRTVIQEVRSTYSQVKVVYIDYEKILPMSYESNTFTVNILDTFGLQHSMEVRDSMMELLDKDSDVNELVISKTDLSDYINGIVDGHLKRGYDVSICNQSSRDINFSGSNLYACMEGRLEMKSIYPEVLKSLVKINDKLSVFIHVVESIDAYLNTDNTESIIYEVVLVI